MLDALLTHCSAHVPDAVHERTDGRTNAEPPNTPRKQVAFRNARDVRRHLSGLESWGSFDWGLIPEGFVGPRRNCAAGWLYVIEFSFDVIKVGQTIAPRNRLQGHLKDAARFGGTITRFWFCDTSGQWMSNESFLILWCATNGRQTFGEYFADLNYARTVAYADELTARRVS